MRRVRTCCTFALTLALCACRAPADEPAFTQAVAFDTGTVTIVTATDTIQVGVEFARTPTEQQYGLMDRTALPGERGMLFVYDTVQDTAQGFWMFRTKIPLDVAFIDSAGTIVAIRSMDPCTSPVPDWCQGYTPGERYQSALEVNRGFYQRHGIKPGALIRQPRQ